MRHALAVLAGLAVGMPVMAALASVNGHTAGGLPDRYVPWARAGHHIHSGFAPLWTPARRRTRPEAHRTFERVHRVEQGMRRAAPMTLSRTPQAAGSRTQTRDPVRVGASMSPEPTADLRVSISAPRTVQKGGAFTYRIKLANRGPGTPSAITVRSLLPKDVVRTGSTLPDGVGGYAGGRDATLVMPRLAPGGSATARFDVRVSPKAHGDLVAHTRIAYVGGARLRRPRESTASVSTRVR